MSKSRTPDTDPDDGVDTNPSDQYGTPVWFIKRLQKHLPGGLFDRDLAAGAEVTQIARERWTKADDALSQPEWAGPDIDTLFLNPPFSDPEPFLRRLVSAVDPADPTKANFAVTITRSDTTTGWFQSYISQAEMLWFYNGRFSFHNPDVSGNAGFACTVGLFGDVPDGLMEDLAKDGQFYTQKDVDAAKQQQSLTEMATGDDRDTPGVPVMTPNGTTTTNLGYARPRDLIHVTLESNALVSGVPEELTLEVLPDGKEANDNGTGVRLHATGVTDDGDDVCAQLESGESIPQPVALTIAIEMDDWELATPTEIRIERQGVNSP